MYVELRGERYPIDCSLVKGQCPMKKKGVADGDRCFMEHAANPAWLRSDDRRWHNPLEDAAQ